MRKISDKEVQLGLNQLVGIKFLQVEDGKYKYNKNYKDILLKSKGESIEEVLIDALCLAGYFLIPRTEREIQMVISLLTLKNGKR